VRRLLILETSLRVLYPSILVLSLYFLFAGHNQPGGGFVGGLAAGAAISLRYVAGGVQAVRTAFRLAPWTILGLGLLTSVGTAFVPVLLGHNVLEQATFERELPLLGTVKATSALPFDIGVYLVVVGLVLMAFEAFGEDIDEEIEVVEDPGPVATRPRDDFIPTEAEARRRAAGHRLIDGGSER
jgi:multicomponent Na+:H+ antiporter subunit A